MELIILANVILAVALAAGSFLAGKHMADTYNAIALQQQKEALERQYMRLRVHMDADDPCKPYVATHEVKQTPLAPQQDPLMDKELLAQFGNRMKKNGQATALLNNKRNLKGETK